MIKNDLSLFLQAIYDTKNHKCNWWEESKLKIRESISRNILIFKKLKLTVKKKFEYKRNIVTKFSFALYLTIIHNLDISLILHLLGLKRIELGKRYKLHPYFQETHLSRIIYHIWQLYFSTYSIFHFKIFFVFRFVIIFIFVISDLELLLIFIL